MNDNEREVIDDKQEPEGEQPQDGEQAKTEEDVDILKEVSALGQQFGEALKDIWGSDERKNIEKEFVRGMQIATDEVRTVADDVRKGKTAKDLKDGADLVGQDVRKGILSGLRMFNKELRKARSNRPDREGEE